MFVETSTEWLEIPDEIKNQAWQQSQSIQIPGFRWQACLNHMALQTLLPWLQEKSNQEPHLASPAIAVFWSMVNGSAVTVGTTRLVLIPIEATDTQEFRVPQEWIDIPNWVGDYYFAVEVDADAGWVNIWGYATHEKLKLSGEYDPSDRTYCLEGIDLIPNLSAFWVMQQLATETTRTEIAPLPRLTNSEAESLIQQLQDPAIALVRLEVPFSTWGALLAENNWLQNLCEQRLSPQSTNFQATVQPTNLGQWWQNLFEVGWRSLEEIFGTEPDLAFSFRQDTVQEDAIRRAKRIQLGGSHPDLLLVMLLGAEADGRRRIWIQLLPWLDATHLPTHTKLTLLTPTGETLQTVESGEQSNYIQLRRFKCSPGTEFRLQIAIADASMMEEFVS